MPVSHLLKKCVTFTKKILNGKIHFLCSVIFPSGALYLVNILISFVSKTEKFICDFKLLSGENDVTTLAC